MEDKTTGRITIRLIVSILLMSGCSAEPEPPVAPLQQEERTPDQESWNATIYLLEDARHRIIVDANHRLFYQTDQETILDEGLTVRFFDEEGNLSSTLTAERGRIFESSQDMTVYGNVLIVSREHGRLETDSLRWVEQENRITTEADVQISTERDIITGVGFEADPDLEEWRILHNVKGRFDRGDELEEQFDVTPES